MNQYALQLGNLFSRCPKSVLAAIAVSLATSGGDFLENARSVLALEWVNLYDNGIVSQRPPQALRDLALKWDASRRHVEVAR